MTASNVRYRLLALAVAVAIVGIAGPVDAQRPTLNPRGGLSNPAKPAPRPAPAPVIVNLPGAKGEAAAGPSGYFFTDDVGTDKTRQHWDSKLHGPVPEHHVVRRGDTLWDISWIYFNNPWEWPKVWAYNPSITNPHWIYPGDLVRLYQRGEGAVVVVDDPDDPVDFGSPTLRRAYNITLRMLAYVDRRKLKYDGTITGSRESKEMLSTGDHVYLTYPAGKPPKVGKRYAIYLPKKEVRHPVDKKVVGHYVRIIGELRVVSVKEDKRARAIIEEASDVIERGARVGPIQRKYSGDFVKPVANTRNLQGVILAMLRDDQLIGEGEIVFIDLGKKQVKRGNILHVVRRGDAYHTVMAPGHNVGQDNRTYPSRSVGTLMVVDVGRFASTCIVITSKREFEPGDLVLMRKAR